ncbi:MAG: hypothetical protein KDB00_13180 [Planctomycetales bacterium]|nr:hypothetical protein [Planctomycetales bacterium]
MTDQHAKEYSLLPFAICQEWQLQVGYERSFKVQSGKVLSNRYLIGIPTEQLTSDRAREIARRLAMPEIDERLFWGLYPNANLLLIGFEDSEPGCVYKLYLEFDDQPISVNSGQGADQRLLHRGVKWNVTGSSNWRISDYRWHPGMATDEISHRINSILAGTMIEHPINDLVNHATANIDGDQLRYLEVVEGNRRSFDLNLYASGLPVLSVMDYCRHAGAGLGASMEPFDQLESIVGRQLLGHLAAGLDSKGNDFFTVYYDATASSESVSG